MTRADQSRALAAFYDGYIACLNARNWAELGRFVAEDVRHNGRPLGLSGYRRMLKTDVAEIPDLRFRIALMVVEPPRIACRLSFDCAPVGAFLGLPVNGRRVAFCENVFYEVRDGRIAEVWSIIDRAAIAAQLDDG